MSDVAITYSILNELNGSLKQIIVEFEEASKRADVLESAIGDPCGKNKLREAAEEFEDGWNDRRKGLKEDLAKIQEHVESVGSSWADWDTEASKSLTVDGDEVS